MQPHEIGHAAAYEAYRTWIHNSSIYEPLSGDIERQREALTGLAVAEASRLLQYSSHPMDNYAYLAASEAAAHTASYIFYQSRDGEYRSRSQYRQSFDDPYAFDDALFSRTRSHSAHRSRSRHGSFSQPSGIDDPYAFDDGIFSRTRSHSAHRHRSRSRHGSFSQPSAIPLPGRAYSSSSAPMTSYAGQPGSYGSYSNHGGIPVSTPYPHGVPLPPGSSYGSMPMINPPYSGALDVASSYQGSSLGAVDYPRSRSSSFSYPQQGYPQQGYPQQGYGYSQQGYSQPAYSAYAPSYAGSASGMATAPPTTIIIHKSRKSKHRGSR